MTRFQTLLDGYVKGTLTPKELEELLELFGKNQEILASHIDKTLHDGDFSGMMSDQQRLKILNNLRSRLLTRHKTSLLRLPSRLARISAAAAVLVLLGYGLWIFFGNKNVEEGAAKDQFSQKQQFSIPAGGHSATLVLSDGSVVNLEDIRQDTLFMEGGARVKKLGNGQLSYIHNPSAAAAVYNTIQTPRGGQYQITLADGTRVWLNSASSLRFPSVFHGSRREVNVSGEAYFEVARNTSMPFIVNMDSTQVIVLGTRFNINAYTDEKAINTTLLEGSVRFIAGEEQKTLKPGQQSVFDRLSRQTSVHTTDVQQAIAWKNGFFEFNNTDLKTIMRQVCRWYDVEVQYEAHYPDIRFGGGISRNLELNAILDLLRKYGVRFRIDSRKITVVAPG